MLKILLIMQCSKFALIYAQYLPIMLNALFLMISSHALLLYKNSQLSDCSIRVSDCSIRVYWFPVIYNDLQPGTKILPIMLALYSMLSRTYYARNYRRVHSSRIMWLHVHTHRLPWGLKWNYNVGGPFASGPPIQLYHHFLASNAPLLPPCRSLEG